MCIVLVQSTEKLVAFLFGIASHMVADVSWHSLGINQGFLKAMGEVSLDYSINVTGTVSIASSALESGTERRQKLYSWIRKILRETQCHKVCMNKVSQVWDLQASELFGQFDSALVFVLKDE